MEPIEVVIPGPARSYCSLLDQALEERDRKEQAAASKYFPLRPSSAGYCGRKLAYSLAAHRGTGPHVADYKKPSIQRLLELGHSIEWHALRVFKDALPSLKQRFKQQVVDIFRLDSGILIEGSTDVAFTDTGALVDVKSVGPRWSKGYKSSWDEMLAKYESMATVIKFDDNAFYVHDVQAFFEEVGEDALVANITQLNLYLCTEFMRSRNMTHGVIYRYNKADSRHMEIRFAPSAQLFEAIKSKFNTIDKACSPGGGGPEAVPRGAMLGSQACGFCPYAEHCWPEISTKKEYFKTLPKKKWAPAAPAPLEALFDELATHKKAEEASELLTSKILSYMVEKEVKRVKLRDGTVYEAKYLASPKPHYELRITKE